MADMSRQGLRDAFKGILCDAAAKFDDPKLDQQLDTAARELSRVKPTVKNASLDLVADQTDYPAPSDLLQPMGSRWGFTALRDYRPWENNYPKSLPRLTAERDESDTRVLILIPPPNAEQISLHGSAYRYRYSIQHVIADLADDTTVPEDQQDLLLQRALIAALHSLAARQVTAVANLGGSYSAPRNGHPAAIAEQLLHDWHQRILN